MQNLVISPAIQGKLALKHGISRSDVEQCFLNRTRSYLIDNRLDHQTEAQQNGLSLKMIVGY